MGDDPESADDSDSDFDDRDFDDREVNDSPCHDSPFNDRPFNGEAESAAIAPERAANLAGSGEAERHDAARLQRIIELGEHSLARPDPLEASLGCVNTELLNMARLLGPAIVTALGRGEETLDQSQATQEAMHSYLKVVKQVERFAQLQDRRDRDAQRAAARECGPAWPMR